MSVIFQPNIMWSLLGFNSTFKKGELTQVILFLRNLGLTCREGSIWLAPKSDFWKVIWTEVYRFKRTYWNVKFRVLKKEGKVHESFLKKMMRKMNLFPRKGSWIGGVGFRWQRLQNDIDDIDNRIWKLEQERRKKITDLRHFHLVRRMNWVSIKIPKKTKKTTTKKTTKKKKKKKVKKTE